MFISIVTVCISIAFYRKSEKHHRKNIRIGRLEKMLSIIEKLPTIYKRTEAGYKRVDLSAVTIDEIDGLETLSRAYLPEELQLKVLSMRRLFVDLISYLNGQRYLKDMFWKEGFPTIHDVQLYIENLSDELLDEIGFEKGLPDYRKSLREYTDKIFKKEVGIIK